MKQNRRIIWSAILLMILTTGFLMVVNKPKEVPQTPTVETNISSAQVEGVVSNDDGSVIVRDQGASFKIR